MKQTLFCFLPVQSDPCEVISSDSSIWIIDQTVTPAALLPALIEKEETVKQEVWLIKQQRVKVWFQEHNEVCYS